MLSQGVTSWECVLRKHGNRNARVKLSATDTFVETVNKHSHASSSIKCEVAQVKTGLKRRAEDTSNTTQQIYSAGNI